MKYLMQFGIIIGLSLVGEVLNSVIPLPVPASVWGMVLLFVLLCLKVIKLDQVQDAADFLLSIMTVMFVPVGASLITSFADIKMNLGISLSLSYLRSFVFGYGKMLLKDNR